MILLLGNYVHDRQESMQRFLRMLALGLQERGIAVNVLQPEPWAGKLRPSGRGLGKWLGYIDKFIIFPIVLRRTIQRLRQQSSLNERQSPISDHQSTPSLFSRSTINDPRSTPSSPGFLVHIIDHSNGPYCRYLRDVPHLVTCHDVLALRSARGDFPENPTGVTGRLYQKMILAGLRLAGAVACVSGATREQFLELTKLAPARVTVLENGLNYPYQPQPRSAAENVVNTLLAQRGLSAWTGSRFLLHVGGNQWYKNRVGLLAIYAALRRREAGAPPLFLVGQTLPAELRASLDPETSRQVVEMGKVENAELQAFYAAAELLVFPSLYEGFGWPIAEAQAAGCPVVTTDRAPMTEVGGSAAAYLDPSQPEAAAQLIAEILGEAPAARATRQAAGLQNVERFSTERMIDRYVELYRQILTSSAAKT